MATLYRAETTLQDILGMKVGDELKLAGGDLPDYTEDDAGKALQVNQAGTGVEWGPGVPSYTSSDVGKVLTVGEDGETVAPVWQGPVEIDTPFTAPTPVGTTAEELYNSALNGARPVLSANIDDIGHRYFYLTDSNPAEVVWATIYGAFGANPSINIGVLVIQPGKGGVYNMTHHNLSTELSAT